MAGVGDVDNLDTITTRCLGTTAAADVRKIPVCVEVAVVAEAIERRVTDQPEVVERGTGVMSLTLRGLNESVELPVRIRRLCARCRAWVSVSTGAEADEC
jgi:hypothetical protein